MQNFRIFTEGPADIKFIRDYVEEHFGIILDTADFDTLGGYSGYEGGKLKPSIQQNHDDGKETILILDADGDFAQRQKEVLSDFATYRIPVKLFLFPNNQGIGNIETLLCAIAVKQNILRCLDSYDKCIEQYEALDGHERIFAYLGALLPSKNKEGNKNDLIQPKNENYRNPAHWDLRHPYLQPLHDFMAPFF